MVKQLVLVALGGGIGSALRYLSSWWLLKQFSYTFPLGTFIVNITGCLIVGFLMGLSIRYRILTDELKFLLIVGFCGGYTTFSTFSSESIELFKTGHYWILTFYIAGSILFGLMAVWSGNVLSRIGT